jgi:formate hydrogenlyase transcriptional activator
MVKTTINMSTICFEWDSSFNTITDPVSIHDNQFRIIKINPALASLLKENPENILGKKCHQIIHGMENPVDTCPHVKALLNHRSVTEKFWDLRLGKYLEVTCLPIVQKKGQIAATMHIIKDVTPHLHLHETLQQELPTLEKQREALCQTDMGTQEQWDSLIALRKKAEETIKERLEFESLLADILARFINVSPAEISREIVQTLNQIMNFFQVDRCVFLRLLKDTYNDCWEIIYLVQKEETPPPLPINTKLPISMVPWVHNKLANLHEALVLGSLRELPPEASIDRQFYESLGTQANLNIPVVINQSDIYCLALNTIHKERIWPDVYIPRLRILGEILGNALIRCRNAIELNEQLQEIKTLKQKLEEENIYLQEEVKLLSTPSEILGKSPGMINVMIQAQKVAPTDSSVLILGETGTGKELLAREIHKLSQRKKRPMVSINVASLAPTLIESELFGHEKGAYTGALNKHIGRFEVADESTLFLDEIGDLAPELQVKLLRVLQEGIIERLGSSKPVHVNVRIIAATHHDLKAAVQRGKFREDLYYRLAVFPILIPSLRQRTEDIPLMVRSFAKEFAEKMGKTIRIIPQKTIEALQRYPWPGNVRELRNIIERSVILSSGDILNIDLPVSDQGKRSGIATMEEAKRAHILEVLELTGWRIKGPRGAAELLGMKPSSLYTSMSILGIPTKHQKDVNPT